jgi:erythromycin esterase-like protein
VGAELAFAAACNAAVVQDAEAYYRNMFFGEELTWNLRDTHFADAVARVIAHLQNLAREAGLDAGPLPRRPKVVLW